MALSLSGNLRETSFTDVLEIMRLHKAAGTLVCRNGAVEKSVYVQQGKVIFATSNDTRDRLGEILVRAGTITRKQLEDALRLHKQGAGLKKIGALLVENGFVTPKQLFAGLKIQVRDILHSLFLWTEGEYRFDERLPADVIPLQINIEELVRQVLQQLKRRA